MILLLTPLLLGPPPPFLLLLPLLASIAHNVLLIYRSVTLTAFPSPSTNVTTLFDISTFVPAGVTSACSASVMHASP